MTANPAHRPEDESRSEDQIRMDRIRDLSQQQPHGSAYDPSMSPAERGLGTPKWVWMTPEAAEDLLRYNRGNRNISESTVEQHMREILEGRWQETHQGTAIDTEGWLSDGQHRLMALARLKGKVAGVWMLVTTGVPVRSFPVIDTGRKRLASHFIPGPHSSTKSAAARMMRSYPEVMVYNRTGITNEEQLERYVQYQYGIDPAAKMAQEIYRRTKISASAHTAVLATVLVHRGGKDPRVDVWVEGLMTGAGLEVNDPRILLRNRFALDGERLNASSARAESLYLVTRAWNAFALGERLTKLQLPKGGAPFNTPIKVVL